MFTGEDEMLALIDPNTSVSYISGWTQDKKPIFTVITNSARVCEVVADGAEFPVAPPLAWIACGADVVADQWYFDTSTQQFIVIPSPPPRPA